MDVATKHIIGLVTQLGAQIYLGTPVQGIMARSLNSMSEGSFTV